MINRKNAVFLIFMIAVTFLPVPGIGEPVSLKTGEVEDIVAVTSFLPNNGGEIFLYSYKLAKIFKFKPDGTFEKSFCRKGQGPGEINRVLYMFHNPQNDCFYLPEYYSGTGIGKITVYDSGGTYRGLQHVELPAKKRDAIAKLLFLEDGSFFTVTSERVEWKPRGKLFITTDEFRIDYFDKDGNLQSEVFKGFIDNELSNAVRYGGPRILFAPEYLVSLVPGGNIAVARNDGTEISLYNRRGEPVKTVHMQIPREALTDREFEQARNALAARMEGKADDRMLYLAKRMIKLDYKPIYYDFFFPGGSRIVLAKTAGRDESGYVTRSRLISFNGKGEKLNEHTIEGVAKMIRNNRIFIKYWDSDGDEYFKIEPFPSDPGQDG